MRNVAGKAGFLVVCLVAGSLVAAGAVGFSGATDLGTLGGTSSGAAAVSGSIVVGYSDVVDDLAQHAFAYDLADPSPHMIDLGTLGGTNSQATAIDGTIVVGYSSTTDDAARHAFAYDLADPSPHMIDLNTIDGAWSVATAVSGSLVTGGWSIGERGQRFGWVYDLAAPTPEMVDLGALAPNGGQRVTSAVDVSNGIVVGGSYAGLGTSEHAFAYDTADAAPHMTDLGTLGGPYSFAVAIDGSLVVGQAGVPDDAIPFHAFAYDRSDPSPHMVDLDTLGGAYSSANAVDGNVIAGVWQTANKTRSFVYDFASASPHMIDLGLLSGTDSTSVAKVSGTVLVGASWNSVDIGSTTRPFAYDIAASTPHLITLPTLAGNHGNATDVDDAGLIVGSADVAGGAFHAVLWHFGAAIDSTDPTVTITTPTANAFYAQGAAVVADYSCDDTDGSGIASCVGSVADGAGIDTSTPGTHSFSVTAVDAAGNDATTNVSYTVVAPVHVTASVGAGGSLTTDPGNIGPTPSAPVHATVTSPNAGTIDIAQSVATQPTPTGYSFLGVETDITAPAATAASPLALRFALDASLLGGLNASQVVVFRDGVPIGACTTPSIAVAAPANGDVAISVYTSHASHWDLGRQLTTTPALTIPSATLANAQVGVAYSAALVASGGAPPIGWSITSGALPAGLTLDPSTGVIAGTPSTPGTAQFTIRARDTTVPVAKVATAARSITVTPTADPTSAKVGVPYWTDIPAFNGNAPFHWSIASGALPGGLTLDPDTGAISGTPSVEGRFTVTVQVVETKAKKPAKVNTKLTITVAPIAITISPATLPSATRGVKYTAALTASGGVAAYNFQVTAGGLPAGISLSGSGALSGKPTARGTFNFTVTVTDKYGFTATRSFAFDVA